MRTLKKDEEIETLAQLEAAICQIGKIDSLIQTIEAERDQELSDVRQKHEQRLIARKGKQPVTHADVRAELAVKVESYCWANRNELLNGDAKYKQLTHGRIGWAKQPDTFDDTKAQSEGSEAFITLASVAGSLLTYVANLAAKVFGKPIAGFIEVKLSWNKKAIAAAIKASPDDAKLIAEAGFEIVTGLDKFYCTPKRD